MLLKMLEIGYPVDEILFCDTGLEFPQMYDHLDSLERYIGRPITRLQPSISFEYLLTEYQPKRRNPALTDKKGLRWPGPKNRWCTGRMKQRVLDRHLKELSKEYEIRRYIGIAANEKERCKGFCYPLVEWGMTEADCLRFCRERGFDWDGLYDIFRRVSCWCCPLQPLSELRKLWKYFPNLWQRLLELDSKSWRQFRADYSVRQLEARFEMEKEWQESGRLIRSRAFFAALKGGEAYEKPVVGVDFAAAGGLVDSFGGG